MLWVLVLLLLLQAQVVTTPVTKCHGNKYALGRLCCDLCPPGHHVSADCTESQATRCSPCPPSTFMAHHNHDTQCQICADCRDFQEVVKNCTPTSDQQCQCKTGQYYCDTENCPERCYPCTRCPGVTLHPCTATRDTVCATEPSPAPGIPWGTVIIIVIAIGVAIVIAIGIGLICCYCGRGGVQHIREAVRCFKTRSGEPGSHVRSRESVQPNEDPESGPPAPGVETTPLMEEGGSALAPGARPCPGPSDDPGEAVKPMVVSRGSKTTPELAPRAVPDAHRSLSWASLRRLEQEYKQKYFLKDVSYDAINTLYHEFRQKLPEHDWKIFMNFVGTEENDAEVCDHDNPGTLTEPHHQITVCLKEDTGRDVFRLIAVLHQRGLHESLENIINMLIAANIIGSRAETPN